jgi:hypothetical protein
MSANQTASRIGSFLKQAGTNQRLIFSLVCLFLSAVTSTGQNSAAAYIWTTLAGKAGVGSADGPVGVAQFNNPYGVATDSGGNTFVVDRYNYTIRKITPAGVVSTIAGLAGFSGSNDGANTTARFVDPKDAVVDSLGNLYVADNFTIRKITLQGTNWVVSTIVGLATSAGGTDGTNSAARLNGLSGITIDGLNNLYLADAGAIRKVTPVGTNWVVRTLAGTVFGAGGFADGTNSDAQFNRLGGITVDTGGNLYVADYNSVRKISPVGTNWVVRTIAAPGANLGSADGTNSSARFNTPTGITVDSANNIYVADTLNQTIRLVQPAGTNWVVTTPVGQVNATGTADGIGIDARFNRPANIRLGGDGNLYVADAANNAIRKINPSSFAVSTIAGAGVGAGSTDGTTNAARFYGPSGVAVDGAGNVYVADLLNNTVRKITAGGVVSTLAGLALAAGSTDGTGSLARFYYPSGVTVDTNGNIYVADLDNYTIRKVTPNNVVTTIAGFPGNNGSADGTGTNAQFGGIFGLAMDRSNTLYVADYGNYTVRKLKPVFNANNQPTNWVVTTIAGLAGVTGGTDGTNGDARFQSLRGITVDNAGNLYVTSGTTVRMLTPIGTNWVTRTIAGLYGVGNTTDGVGSVARFNQPAGIASDSFGALILADQFSHTIRKLTPVGTNWVVSTIGGLSNSFQDSADRAGGAARFYQPNGVAVDSAGNVYVADSGNNIIRKGVFTAYAPSNAVPYVQPPMTNQLTVTLLPPEAGGQWRFSWEVTWRNSGQTASNLMAGNYPVVFRPLPGWLVLSFTQPVAVINSVAVTNQYYPTLNSVGTNNGGSLTVTLGSSPPSGAGWRFLGDTTPFYPSGYTTNLAAGTYLIEFAAVNGFVKPPNLSVQVKIGLPAFLVENYLAAGLPPSGILLPFQVLPSRITNLNVFPFRFNGQLQTDVGYGSGVAVQTNVVLTAAHLLFNDQTISYVSQASWFFQREVGTFDPQPLQARGWYVLSGYASQRTNDLAGLPPDTSTPQSRNFDVAALYFFQPVAGGGYSGYLPSDASPNPWLTGNSLKMLVGYPVDGTEFGDASIATNAGTMYQTDPQPFPLSLATDPVANQQVYAANWFLSYPGNSGGPVFVQYNGFYYPAGVYLGTLYNNGTAYASAVRAIDSQVLSLITNAAYLVDTGTNPLGGGIITITNYQPITAANPGYLQFTLSPPAAVAAGAAWRLSGDATYSTATNYMRAVLTTNGFGVEFKPIAGWNVPTNQALTVLPGQISVYAANYTPASITPTNPVLVANLTGLGITGTTGTVYRIERRTSLTTGVWLPVSTNTIFTSGFNLLLSNPATNGSVNFYRAVWLP